MALQTTIKSAFITDLILPQPGSNGKSAEEIQRLAIDIALALTHDSYAMIKINPLVTKVEQIPLEHPKAVNVPQMCKDFGVSLDSPEATSTFVQYAITDKLNVAFGYSTALIYHAAIRGTTTGMESVTDPGSGVRIYGRFDIRRASDQPGVIHFIENNETRCNVFLGVYIKATLASSHKTVHENFKKRWNDEIIRRMAL